MPTPADTPSPDTPCIACGYSLRGIADDGKCPECGMLAVKSRAGGPLARVTSRTLRRVRIGAWGMGVAIAGTGLLQAATIIAISLPNELVPDSIQYFLINRGRDVATWCLRLIETAACLLFLLGVFPSTVWRDASRRAKALWRLTVTIVIVFFLRRAVDMPVRGVDLWHLYFADNRNGIAWMASIPEYVSPFYHWPDLFVYGACCAISSWLAKMAKTPMLLWYALAMFAYPLFLLMRWVLSLIRSPATDRPEQTRVFVQTNIGLMILFGTMCFLTARLITRELRHRQRANKMRSATESASGQIGGGIG